MIEIDVDMVEVDDLEIEIETVAIEVAEADLMAVTAGNTKPSSLGKGRIVA